MSLIQPTDIDNAEIEYFLDPQTQLQGFQLPLLYKLSSYDKVQVWYIGFNGKEIVSRWAEQEKFRSGNFQESKNEVLLNNSGKNIYEQALMQTQRKWKDKQMKDGYNVSLTDGNILTLNAMLAVQWTEKIKIRQWPVYVQPKLDGTRALANINTSSVGTIIPDESVILLSRANKPYYFMNHIRRDLFSLFDIMNQILRLTSWFDSYPGIKAKLLTNKTILFRFDGELYTFDKFNIISSITSRSTSRHPNEEIIKYYIFDIVFNIDLTYDERYYILRIAFTIYFKLFGFKTNLIFVDTYLANSVNDIQHANKIFSSWGYEGVIIRKVEGEIIRGQILSEDIRKTSYYVDSRKQNLLKYKSRYDDEGIIIDADEGSGNQKGLIIWIVQLKNGKTLRLQPSEEFETRRKQLEEWKATNGTSFRGKKYRYIYQELSPDGIPRFAVGDGFVLDR